MNNNWPSNIKSVVLPNETGKEPVIPDGWKLTTVYFRDGWFSKATCTGLWNWTFSDTTSEKWNDIVSYRIEKEERTAGRKESATADSVAGRKSSAGALENGVAGRKDDAGKPRIWEVMDGFKRALWAVAQVGTWGGEVKYSDRPFDNWANVPEGYRRYSNSRERHYLASDGDINEESGMPHEWHAVWCALAALELKLREKDGE